MTVKTTLSFTDRHHKFMSAKVDEGVFASQSAVVASAIENMMRDEQERDIALEHVSIIRGHILQQRSSFRILLG